MRLYNMKNKIKIKSYNIKSKIRLKYYIVENKIIKKVILHFLRLITLILHFILCNIFNI